ncbi:MAG: DUF885 domain-containing protein [Gammaproteobacteria bacterium]|nr:DUF885 domain-containing protein [Gammaproteobacteria bacterium]MDH5303859.1 DUF885 domain-containing protein [Gammaproteobacteria bacterium]
MSRFEADVHNVRRWSLMKTFTTQSFVAVLTLAALLAACNNTDLAAEQAGASVDKRLAGEAGMTASADSETVRLNVWLNERFEEQLQFSPMRLTTLGRKDLYDQIDDISEQAARDQAAWGMNTIEQMKAQFDRNSLSTAGKESFDLWVFQAEKAAKDLEFMRQDYLFGELGGWEDWFPRFLISYHRVDDEADMRAYIDRIGGVSRAMDQVVELATAKAADGIRPPRFAYATAMQRAQNVITGRPFDDSPDSPLLADAKNKIEALATAELIDEDTASGLLAEVTTALTKQLQPAYSSFVDWLESDMPNADEQARGVWALPNGKAFYDHQLATYTTLPMTADDVHQLGMSEVQRILAEMDDIRADVGFEGDLKEFFEFIRTDSQFYYPNTDAGREAYLADTRAFLAEIEQKLPEYFGTLPKAKLEVKRVESFREVDGGAQHYSRGTPDGSRPGVYYVHMSDMSAYSKTDMETTAYHEGSPGHHMQISIAQELTGVPTFRTQAGFSVYSEGWGLYSEKLSKEMGQFKDPYRDFGRLTAEMWRAIRLVVDTGLHAKGWTQEQAEQFFFDHSAIPESAVISEVRRYITTPGQATSYKVGMLKIEELRRHAETILGDQFDIRGFHDVVLGGGALPMPLLETRVNNWIADQQG